MVCFTVDLFYRELQELWYIVEEGQEEDGEDVELPDRQVVTELEHLKVYSLIFK